MLEKEINTKEEILDTWNELVPKVFDMCSNSECQRLKGFLSTYTYDGASDGNIGCMCVVC